MSLPKIVEIEPWLEEDDDFPVKKSKTSGKIESAINSTSLTKLLKSGVYLYIIIGLILKTNITRSLLITLKSILGTNKFYMPLLISLSIAGSSLIKTKFLNQ